MGTLANILTGFKTQHLDSSFNLRIEKECKTINLIVCYRVFICKLQMKTCLLKINLKH